MITIILSVCLIFFAIKELLGEYQYYKKKQGLNALLNEEIIKPLNVSKNNKTVAFEKIVAKNSATISFLNRFQEQQIWKVYAIIIIFGVVFLTNTIFDLFELSETMLCLIMVVTVILVIIVPENIVKMQAAKRIKMISKDLPIIIDMMAIMVKSGMTVENGFKYLSKRAQNINKDIASILERACLMMEVNGIELAIDLIYREIPSKEMRMFCTTLRRNINYGNSIYDALLDLSNEIREMQRLTIEEKIAAVSAKMTVPMMFFIMLPVLIVIIGPIGLKILEMKASS